MNKADAATEDIFSLFEQYGDNDYDGEPVSQTSHMLQCGMRAMDLGEDEELILGAFLHDIGHLLRHRQKTEAMGNYGVVNHEGLGADYLRSKGFSERVCAMVEKHVDAKRYLVATKPDYKNRLSEASMQTLIMQGGPMNEAEVKQLEKHPYFEDIIKVRYWDEEAKDAHAVLLPLSHFKKLVHDYLNEKH